MGAHEKRVIVVAVAGIFFKPVMTVTEHQSEPIKRGHFVFNRGRIDLDRPVLVETSGGVGRGAATANLNVPDKTVGLEGMLFTA